MNSGSKKTRVTPLIQSRSTNNMEQEKRQKELLDVYQQVSRYWLDRTQSEMTLWANLGSKLATSRSFPEGYEAFAKCVSQQMAMTAEDAQHLLNDWQHMTQRITQSLNNGGWWPKGST
jgi:hypothetical protein